MSGNPKFLISERNGVEFEFQTEYIPDATDVTFDDTGFPYTAATVQEAIGQAGTATELPIFTIPLIHNGNVANGTYFGYNEAVNGLDTPILVPINAILRGYTFSNTLTTADYTLRFKKNSSSATPFYTVSKVNTRFFSVDGLTQSFNAGDTIYIEYVDDGTNANDVAILLVFKAV